MSRKLKVGDWIEVRSKEEILRTLDAKGQLDGTPFMPEMFKYCEQRLQVYKSAHKTCDYTTQYPFHTRWLADTVHLDTRCNGEMHGGCQAACLLYWKLAWLKPVGKDSAKISKYYAERVVRGGIGCTEAQVWASTQLVQLRDAPITYVCQATQVHTATTALAWWDVRQYIEDYLSGNVGIERLISGLVYSAYYHLSQAGIGVGPAMRWFHNGTGPRRSRYG